MPPKRSATPAEPHARFTLRRADDDAELLVAEPVLRRLRFLFSDGRTLDVLAVQDDSDLRAAVLGWTGAERIEGVAYVPEPEPDAEP